MHLTPGLLCFLALQLSAGGKGELSLLRGLGLAVVGGTSTGGFGGGTGEAGAASAGSAVLGQRGAGAWAARQGGERTIRRV